MGVVIIILIVAVIVFFIYKSQTKQSEKEPTTTGQFNVKVEVIETASTVPEPECKFETDIDGHRVILLADKVDIKTPGYAYWVNIIFQGKKYGYSPEINKWAYRKTGMPPEPYANKIAEWVNNQFSYLQKKPLSKGSIRTTYRNNGKTKFSLKGEMPNGNIIWAYLEPGHTGFGIHLNDVSWVYNINTGEFITPPANSEYLLEALRYWLEIEVNKKG